MKVYEALGRALAAESSHAFGLLGDGNMYTMACYASVPGARIIQGRHENAVVAMADAFARASGQTGLCTVIDGPGLTQVPTSLVIAAQHRTPLVLFAGDVPVSQSYNIHGFDQRALARASGAEFIHAGTASRVLDACREAFVLARTKKCPVVLSVPSDVQDETLDWVFDYDTAAGFIPPEQAPLPPDEAILAAASRIRAARRPVIIAGRGAVESGADAAIARLAERIGALTGTSIRAKGLLRDSAYDLGIVGAFASNTARALMVEADCVIGVGAGLGYYTTEGGYLFPGADRIQIDLDPVGLNTGQYVADTYLRGDAARTVERLTELLGDTPGTAGYRTAEVAGRLARARDGLVPACKPSDGTADGVHPMEAMLAVDDLITEDTAVVLNVGHSWAFPVMALSHIDPRRFFVLDDFGVIGQAFPAAIGVAVARPGSRVLCIDGDGSFLMQIQELETAVREGVDLALLVLNDGAFGAEVHKMNAKGLNGGLTHFGRPRFAEIARGFGATAESVSTLPEVPGALERLLKGSGVRLLDLWTDGTVASPAYNRLYFGAAGDPE